MGVYLRPHSYTSAIGLVCMRNRADRRIALMHGTFVPRTRWIRSQLTLVLRVYAYTAYSYHRDTAKRRRLGINLRPHLRGFCHRSTGAHSGRCHRHALILLRCRSCGLMPLIRTFAATPLAFMWADAIASALAALPPLASMRGPAASHAQRCP